MVLVAVTSEEKELWSKLNLELRCSFDCVYGVAGVLKKCNEVLNLMRKIIKSRGKGLDKNKAGVGVRGMRDILSGQGAKFKCGCSSTVYFLRGTEVSDENFDSFCGCLKAISKLSRGGFLWMGSSALSKKTQELCFEFMGTSKDKFYAENIKELKAKVNEKFDEEVARREHEKDEKAKREQYDLKMKAGERLREMLGAMSFEEIRENLKGEEDEKLRWEIGRQLDDMEKHMPEYLGEVEAMVEEEKYRNERKEFIRVVLVCYLDQDIYCTVCGSDHYPWVTELPDINCSYRDNVALVKDYNYKKKTYVGPFYVKFCNRKYEELFVFGEICENSNGNKFNGPSVIHELKELRDDSGWIVID